MDATDHDNDGANLLGPAETIPAAHDATPIGPTLDEQIERLQQLGPVLHPQIDRDTLWRAISRGVTPADLNTAVRVPEEPAAHRRLAYWWLLCERIGDVPVLADRVPVDLADHVGDHLLTEYIKDPAERAHAIWQAAGEVMDHVAVWISDVRVISPKRDRFHVSINDALYDWTKRSDRSCLADVIEQVLPRGRTAVMLRDVVDRYDVPDEVLIVPASAAPALRELLAEVLPVGLAGARHEPQWEQPSATKGIQGPVLETTQMTSDLAEDPRAIPPWAGVHAPMALARQLEELAVAGLVPREGIDVEERQAPAPHVVPTLEDRPYRALFTTSPDTGPRGLLHGMAGRPLRIRTISGADTAAQLLAQTFQALAEAIGPEQDPGQVRAEETEDGNLAVTVSIGGTQIEHLLLADGDEEEVWDSAALLERVAREHTAEGWGWVRLDRFSPVRSNAFVPFAHVPLEHRPAVERWGRMAFGDVERHRIAARQEQLWRDWLAVQDAAAQTRAMTPAQRLAELAAAGIRVRDPEDEGLALVAARADRWQDIIATARHDGRTIFAGVHTLEDADGLLAEDELPEHVAQMARDVGRADVRVREIQRVRWLADYEVRVAGAVHEISVDLENRDSMILATPEVAEWICPERRAVYVLGLSYLWVLEERVKRVRRVMRAG